MDFSDALRMLNEGHRVRRDTWPTGQYVVKQKGYPEGIPINRNTAEATGLAEGTVMRFSPYLMMYDGHAYFESWTPNQSDLFDPRWVWLSDPYTITFEPNEVRGIAGA
jgi:hypothetical protein